jgi:hypothetical protein
MIATKVPFVFETSVQDYFDLTLSAILPEYVNAYFTRMGTRVQHFSVDETPDT